MDTGTGTGGYVSHEQTYILIHQLLLVDRDDIELELFWLRRPVALLEDGVGDDIRSALRDSRRPSRRDWRFGDHL